MKKLPIKIVRNRCLELLDGNLRINAGHIGIVQAMIDADLITWTGTLTTKIAGKLMREFYDQVQAEYDIELPIGARK